MTHNQKEQLKQSAQDKIRVAVSIVGTEKVWNALDDFIEETGVPGLADDLAIETDGSIYSEETGRYLTETELEEFISWAERENA